jgi:uncharacterized protein
VQCPFDATQLQVVNRHGVEIDWCPSCKGVWLERGELDKIIERAGDDDDDDRPRVRDDDDRSRFRDDDDDRYRQAPYAKKKKKKNFLSEMFEFGGD